MKIQNCMAIAMLGIAVAGPAAAAGAYPERPIRMIVAGGAGSVTDATARLVADLMGPKLGTSIVVENRPGANGILGNESVARAEPDGYTLLFTYAATMVVNPWLIAGLSYDPLKDFTPIGRPTQPGGNVLVVNTAYPAKTVAELIEQVKAAPTPPLYCSWGMGSGGHLAMEFIIKERGLKLEHAPYKSAAACANDLAAGHVQIGFADAVSPKPHIESGKLRALAVSATQRLLPYPDVPTLKEEGIPYELDAWLAIFGPKGLPDDITAKLNRALNEAIAEPEARKRFAAQQSRPAEPNTPEELRALLEKDLKAWGDLAKAVGLKPQ